MPSAVGIPFAAIIVPLTIYCFEQKLRERNFDIHDFIQKYKHRAVRHIFNICPAKLLRVNNLY